MLGTLQAHGVAGLFIEPERALISCRPSILQSGSRNGTALHHAHLPEELFETVTRALTEGVGVRSAARIFKVDKKTVLRVLARAADHAVKVSSSLLKDIVVSECQLDEMWSFIGKKEGHLDCLEGLEGILGDAWIWIAFDAVHKVVVAYVVGKRTQPHAVALLQEVKRVTVRIPSLFSSDQLDQYASALLQVYGVSVTPPRKPGPGRPRLPTLVPPDDLLYAQVVKEYKRNRVASITSRLVFGDPQRLEAVLQRSEVSHKINTSYVERTNGTVRHLDARCSRKTYRFSKCTQNHQRQLALSLTYYHLCLPHKTLTKSHGRATTPFMAAGLTDHVWTMRELLQYQPEEIIS